LDRVATGEGLLHKRSQAPLADRVDDIGSLRRREASQKRDARGLPAPGPPVMNDRTIGQAQSPDGLLHGEMLRKHHFYVIANKRYSSGVAKAA